MLYNHKFTIIANWKMNPCSYSHAKNLLNSYLQIVDLEQINLIVAVPYVYLGMLHSVYKSKNVTLSAQNISYAKEGAFTGEISTAMLQDFGIKYTIIGHSECREHYKESNELVAKKFMTAISSKINPIICVGETAADFAKGDLAVQKALMRQIDCILYAITCLKIINLNIFIAYEPIWAIGSNIKIKISYIKKTCNFIVTYLKSKIPEHIKIYILYGGNVNPDNIQKIKQIPNLAGVLVGSGSLDPLKFNQICKI